MAAFLDKLNLRPAERRLVVVIALVVGAVLYFIFIWPQFDEWGKLKRRKADLEQALARFEKEIARTAEYQRELAKLKEKGQSVASEAQALEMQRIVTQLAPANGVQISGYTAGKGPSGSGGRTNVWFEEQTGNLQFVAEESALVNFLHALSSGNSLIRVSSMTLNPDPTRMKLMGNMTLVASYPRRAPARTPAGPSTPGARPPAAAAAPVARPPGAPAPPKSIAAAVATATKPAATNAPTSGTWWSKVKGWFGKTPDAGAKTNLPAKAGAPATPAPRTNPPPRIPPPPK